MTDKQISKLEAEKARRESKEVREVEKDIEEANKELERLSELTGVKHYKFI